MTTLFIIGRILFGGYFIYSGYNHFAKLGGLTGYAQSKGVPMAKFGVVITGIAMLLGGLSVLLGIMPVGGIWILIVTMLLMTFMIHKFWDVTEAMQKMNEVIAFSKNIAIIGALFMLLMVAVPWAAAL